MAARSSTPPVKCRGEGLAFDAGTSSPGLRVTNDVLGPASSSPEARNS